MNSRSASARTHTLLNAIRNESITERQRQELEDLLLENDDAVTAYTERFQLETALHFEMRSAAAARRVGIALEGIATRPADIEPARRGLFRKTPIRRAPLRLGAVALAASLFLAMGYWLVERNRAIMTERQPQPVARLESAENTEWLGETLPEGHQFLEGDSIYLIKGTARISMTSGVEVALRAPCFVSLDDEMLIRLEAGDLTAQVADWAHGFTVSTDALSVVDLGTKFAVSADPNGSAEAHVLDGQVRVRPNTKARTTRQSLLLSRGEALRFQDRPNLTTRLAADRERFDANLSDVTPFKPIDLFNTGAALAPGDEDPHWRVFGSAKSGTDYEPRFAVVREAGYRAHSSDLEQSRMISLVDPISPSLPPTGRLTFQTHFDLAGYDLSSVVVSAQLIANETIPSIRLNGEAVPLDSRSMGRATASSNRFAIVDFTNGFVAGNNVVEFDVTCGGNRSSLAVPALRVEWRAFGRPKLE